MQDSSEILQRLHDSEIDGSLSWSFDGGFLWELGSSLTGQTQTGAAPTAIEAMCAMADIAYAQLPRSKFAEWWRDQRALRSSLP